MNSPDKKYRNPQAHLSQDQLIRYEQDQMDDAEMHRAEQHLLECELCSDALEGIGMLKPQQTEAALQDLKGRLSGRLNRREAGVAPLYWKWAAAASVFLIAGAVFFLLNKEPVPAKGPTAKNEVVQEEKREEIQNAPYLSFKEESRTVDQEKPQVKPGFSVKKESEKNSPQEPVILEKKSSPQERAESKEETGEAADLIFGEHAEEEVPEREDRVLEEIIFEEKKNIAQSETVKHAPAFSRPSGEGAIESIEYMPAEKAASDPGLHNGTITAGYKVLSGRIMDASGEPLPGVNVRIADSDKGAITDLDGEYSLQLPPDDTALYISFVGFETQKVAVPDNAVRLEVVLEEDVKSLSEVVVTGYGTRQKRSVTGAATSSEAEIIPPKPVGGMWSFKKYIRQNRRYTDRAREAQAEGKAEVEFFVEPDGSLTNFQVRKPIGFGLDEEAIRLIKEGPKWEPATSGGKPVRHKAGVKISFKPE